MRTLVLFSLLASAMAFVPAPLRSTSAPLTRVSATASAGKSKAVPFLDRPENLPGDGSIPGDVGFDPLGLSAIDIDFTNFMVPTTWSEGGDRKGLKTIDWMRESEIKHGRYAMLAVLGWVAVDLGLRLPFDKYTNVASAVDAHNAFVQTGDMRVGLVAISLLELIGGMGLYEMSKGSERKPGQFLFDPLRLGSTPEKYKRYEVSEIKNGRLAMLAFGGICTQAVLTGHGFPYLN